MVSVEEFGLGIVIIFINFLHDSYVDCYLKVHRIPRILDTSNEVACYCVYVRFSIIASNHNVILVMHR